MLAIAGSDSSGGAGIQADIKTIAAHGLFAETAITALTAQNTCGVRDVMEATPQMVAEQMDAVFEDIPPAAVKVGMVPSAAIAEVIAARLERWGARNVVVDPVMVATLGRAPHGRRRGVGARGAPAAARTRGHAQHPRGGGASWRAGPHGGGSRSSPR